MALVNGFWRLIPAGRTVRRPKVEAGSALRQPPSSTHRGLVSPQPNTPRQQKPYLHTRPRPGWRIRRLTEYIGVKTVWPAAITHKDGLRRQRPPGMVEPTVSGTAPWFGKSPPQSRAGVIAARFA